MIEVTVDSGPVWLQYVVAFGTLGAALSAGWAAWSARAATRQTKRLVELEAAREARAIGEAEWRQARRVSIDLSGQPVTLPDGRGAHDMHLAVLNGGPDPIRKCRVKVVADGCRWGPQLIGTVPPRTRVAVTTRVITDTEGNDANGYVRFLDVEGRAWIAEARGELSHAEQSPDQWIAEGREFGAQSLTPKERGTVAGMEPVPDFDAWREHVAGGDSWDGPRNGQPNI